MTRQAGMKFFSNVGGIWAAGSNSGPGALTLKVHNTVSVHVGMTFTCTIHASE